MTQPLPLDTLLSEFTGESEAWVLRSQKAERYLIVPDDRFPGRQPIRFFMSKLDAERFLDAVIAVNPGLASQRIAPLSVKLLTALRSIAADTTPGHADSFVVHSPNEVYEFLQGRLA
jgi:hypothetical protein